MPYTSAHLRQAAVAIVRQYQPCSPYQLLGALRRDFGASHGEANVTMLTMIRDRQLRRTFDGQLTLPGYRVPAPVGRVVALAVALLMILAFIGWVIYSMTQAPTGPPDGFPGQSFGSVHVEGPPATGS
jgi:hypothetical protein